MKHLRRLALLVFIVALVAIIATGFYRSVMHDDSRPVDTPPGQTASMH